MGRIFIDFVGPIVRSRRGNVAILVVLDGFSKFVTLYPVSKIISEAVVQCLVERYFPCFGVPAIVVSDNERCLNCAYSTTHVFVEDKARDHVPYYPQASQVERFNRNLKVALTIYHHAHHTRWDEHLPSLALTFNTVWHESTVAYVEVEVRVLL
jgi:hypothetical protein